MIKSNATGFKFRLVYYFEGVKKDPSNQSQDDTGNFAVDIHFKTLQATLSFLNETIFEEFDASYTFQNADYEKAFIKSILLHVEQVMDAGDYVDKMAMFYYLPPILAANLELKDLWLLLITALHSPLNNAGRDDENIVLNILRGIYMVYTTKQPLFKDQTSDGLPNDLFLEAIAKIRVDKKSALQILILGLDGEEYQEFMQFMWQIWKGTSSADLKTGENSLITEQSPLFINYRSKKIFGIHVDNAVIVWEENSPKINIAITQNTGRKKTVPNYVDIGEGGKSRKVESGTKEVEIKETLAYHYNPFTPIIIVNLVETYNFKEKKVELQKVSKVYHHFTEQYLEIALTNNETINITGMHKVWVFNAQKWKNANELTLKDTLFNPVENIGISIKKLTIINKEETTYNLEVEKNHNYMVSKKNILNHNTTKVFKYSSTETFNFAFYMLEEGPKGNQIDRYVGITVREHLDIRMGEHRIEGERALAGIKKYNEWKAKNIGVASLTPELHTKMTFFEARVWEQYWISSYGGGKAHKGEGALFNRSNAMSEKAFDDWKKKGKFNPCKFFVK